ncbi:phytoene desaturase family protein [Phytoactinopolyspora mesophila]|uniref:Pyridine nucleotide-disulfide oxidoreductase domain-containing protein 2 n=1 Tax=Phytoactinopolyspora mesophila TaxID=2650750 RepID=A0A7K3LYI7_9ACTN|nr:NAD(P)/FAD-dependent oxidoreductase [Phytoactinopolyspora mesophila]NDL56050.1 NAD(P)-binding protein [Phytoactinopolyspora mesophila]
MTPKRSRPNNTDNHHQSGRARPTPVKAQRAAGNVLTIAARYDAVIVGAGHNGLTAAAYLARAGRRVLVLERLGQVGGAAVSSRVFPSVDAWLSRYSYLVSLFPRRIITELELPITLRRRRYSSFTPVDNGGLLVDADDVAATASSFGALTGGAAEYAAWAEFHARLERAADRLFPTMTEPLMSRAQLRAMLDDDETWRILFEEPIGHHVASRFESDVVRGTVLTDALIGTFADPGDASLLPNRCFLYHVIGNGHGRWDVPVSGMGTVSGALHMAALQAGAQIVTGAEVTALDPSGAVAVAGADGSEYEVRGDYVLAGCAPSMLRRLLGESPAEAPEGAQMKVNMLLRRLPRLRADVDPDVAFSGTFHVNESMTQLDAAFTQAAAGRIPEVAPCEVYCHTLTDDSILSPSLRADGVHTLTLFGLHMPARLFREDNEQARSAAVRSLLASLNSMLAEPIEECLLRDDDGRPCLEAHTPIDIEEHLGMPGGHIFHEDLSWPFAEAAHDVGRWGVETEHPRILVCGAGARRGGGVSGIPGRAAAMAVLRT